MGLLSFFSTLLKTHRKIALFGAVAIIFLLGALVIKEVFFPSKLPTRLLKSITIEAEAVRTASISRTITAVGTLRANQSVTVKPLVSGQVSKIHAEGGQEIRSGEAILSIDDRKYRNLPSLNLIVMTS